jgi:hypothetical protein
MDKTIAGIIGAVGALATVSPALAANAVPLNAEAALHASSYADLLRPIPNARNLLAAVDEARAPAATARVIQVQDVPTDHHHQQPAVVHHRRRHHHPAPPPPPPVDHHHHHHNHATLVMARPKAAPDLV